MNLVMTSRVICKSSSKVLAALKAEDDETTTLWEGAKAEAMAGRSKRVATENFIVEGGDTSVDAVRYSSEKL